jgi:hypothetical protein
MAIYGTIAVLFVGYIIVRSHALVAVDSGQQTWSGLGTVLGGTPASSNNQVQIVPNKPAQQILSQVTSSAPFVYISPSGAAQTTTRPSDAPDVASILAQLSPKSRAFENAPKPTGPVTYAEAYTFVPGGMISTSTGRKRSTEQQALYDYGNEIGGYVQSYDSMHQNVSQIATDALADRQDAEKAERVKQIGRDLYVLGQQISSIEEVPAAAAAANKALGKGYQDVGTALQKVPDAQRDQDLLAAVKTYDAVMDSFIPKYTALVLLFSSFGVTFSPDDPGSAFAFSTQ